MNNEVCEDSDMLKADTILALQKDILIAISTNMDKYVTKTKNDSPQVIIPMVSSSIVMTIKNLEDIFKFEFRELIVELLKLQDEKKNLS
jgi:hypothetical protein